MDQNELKRVFDERGIQHAKVGGFDVDGILRGKLISLEKLFSALDKGFGFCDVIFGWDINDVLYDNCGVTGWQTGYPDTLARIDPTSFRILPSQPDTACFLADFHGADGKPHPACPRNLLKGVIARANASGYRPRFSAEFEFWVFRESPESVRHKGYRDLTPISPGMFGYSWLREDQHAAFLHDVLDTMRGFDIPIEGLHTETGPGVYEVALRYDEALAAADHAALFKTTMKQIAHRHDLMLTFMAKWNAALPGSSGHIHQSLWDSTGQTNLFHDADGKGHAGLSSLALRYLAGQVQLMPELTALLSPTVNTYKRYVPGVWAPLTASWGVENRTCALRAITGPSPSATRIEHRQPAADINPYVAMATCLGAGLYGIDHGLTAPPPIVGDATAAVQPELALPRTLAEATQRLRESEAAREALGEAFVDHYVRTREWEARQYDRAVSDWELARYFEAI